jgi:hypothetical protein
MNLLDRINNPQPVTVKLWMWIEGLTLTEIAQRLGMTRKRFLELNPQYVTRVPQIGDQVRVDWER